MRRRPKQSVDRSRCCSAASSAQRRFATALDPEDLSRLIERYQDACAGAVARFDGYIAKFMGNSVLAYFGIRRRTKTQPNARCAPLAIVDTVRQIERLDGVSLQTRVGIATSVVVVGESVGNDAAREERSSEKRRTSPPVCKHWPSPIPSWSAATCRLLARGFDYEVWASISSRDLPSRSRPGAS